MHEHLPDLKIRLVNVVDLMKLQPPSEHPHGLSDRDFDALFIKDKLIDVGGTHVKVLASGHTK